MFNDLPCAPVLLIGFNRPERLAAQIERLRRARPSRVFLAVDGPRDGRPGEAALVERSRAVVDLIEWPCEVRTRFLNENHGCRFAPPEAISWMLEEVESGIILEDDCAPTPEFLAFASELLSRYRDDSRVGMITGDNFYGFQTDHEASYRFSRHVHIWGWATWRRAWRLYDGTMARYTSTVSAMMSSKRRTKFDRYWAKYLAAVLNDPTTWDIQWCVAMRANDLLCATPRCNLVSNIGHDSTALHTSGFVYDVPHFVETQTLGFPLHHPGAVACDESADRCHANRSAGYVPRALTFFVSKMPWLEALGVVAAARFVERLLPGLFHL